VAQAKCLDGVLNAYELNCVLELKVDEQHLLERILGRAIQARKNGEAVRADDNAEALSVRLAAYANQTKPLTDYYAAKGLLKTIDASLPVDRVTAALVEAIK
jgi:adenylate kinase